MKYWILLFAAVMAQADNMDVEPLPSAAPTPVAAASDVDDDDEDTVVDLPYVVDPTFSKGEPWTPPDYGNQENALGYVSTEFNTPEILRTRVDFWKNIYGKYTSDQGLLHDADYIDMIYEVVDFGDIAKNLSLNEKERHRAKKKQVKEKKTQIVDRLNRLQKVKDPSTLEGEDLRYWKMFENITEKNKFREAGGRKRLRFQLGQADFFKKGIYYSGRYLKRMEEIFREAGLPMELTRLPFVESSFNIYARSRVGASGIWQFMRSTGRLYMKVNGTIDERNDPITATKAAVKLLRFNHKLLTRWPLAITAYNYGPAGIDRLVKKYKTTELTDLIKNAEARKFGFASQNFYACFLAAKEIEQEAEKYFGAIKRAPEVKFEEKILTRGVRFSTLARIFGEDRELTDLYNAHLSRRLRGGTIPKGTRVRVPAGRLKEFEDAIAAMKPEKQEGPLVLGKTQYEVVAGDTFYGIANDFGIKMDDLLEANDIEDPRSLKPGKVLVIPEKRISTGGS